LIAKGSDGLVLRLIDFINVDDFITMKRIKLVYLIYLFISVGAFFISPFYLLAEEFRVAGIYSKNKKGSSTVNNELGCIMEGVFQHAKTHGVPVSIDIYDSKRSSVELESIANQIVAKKYNAVIGTSLSSEMSLKTSMMGAFPKYRTYALLAKARPILTVWNSSSK
jgi:hypothetical protein